MGDGLCYIDCETFPSFLTTPELDQNEFSGAKLQMATEHAPPPPHPQHIHTLFDSKHNCFTICGDAKQGVEGAFSGPRTPV